ncbi:hypothetical protein ACOMHN_011341 [Nucella lapillus]
MLDINIEVINTITPDWTHDVHPRQKRSEHTLTIGLLGEQHYVALEKYVARLKKNSLKSQTMGNTMLHRKKMWLD